VPSKVSEQQKKDTDMNRKILIFLLFMFVVVFFVTVFARLLPLVPFSLNAILEWTTPALLILSYIFSIGIAVWRNLKMLYHFAGFSALFPTHIAVGVISKWGVRW
jgi:hypothetical protein